MSSAAAERRITIYTLTIMTDLTVWVLSTFLLYYVPEFVVSLYDTSAAGRNIEAIVSARVSDEVLVLSFELSLQTF